MYVCVYGKHCKERKIEKQKEREKSKTFYLLIHSSNAKIAGAQQGQSDEPGTPSHPPRNWQKLKHFDHLLLPSQAYYKELGQTLSSHNSNCPYGMLVP